MVVQTNNTLYPDREHDFHKELGHGAFGVVSKVQRRSDGKWLARKDISYLKQVRGSISINHSIAASARKEAALLRVLDHPNIVRLYDVRIIPEVGLARLYMEYCAGGSLEKAINSLIRDNAYLGEDFVWYIFRQLASAVSYLHHNNIIHRDIKPANVLFANKIPKTWTRIGDLPTLKLADFGIGAVGGSGKGTKTFGTMFYLAPEIHAQIKKGKAPKHNRESDMYALGLTMLEVARMDKKGGKSKYSEKLRTLIGLCIAENPENRPSARYICRVTEEALESREKRRRHKDIERVKAANKVEDENPCWIM